MNFHQHYARVARPVEACLVGSGSFGRSFLAQAARIPLVNARIAVDMTAEAAAKAFAAAGIEGRDIAVCATPAEARAAWNAGQRVAAGSLDTVLDLPFDILIEATGAPVAAARHSLAAIEAGRHVALVSKEADSVVGPGLARLAAEKGVVVTPVDGDQPSLLIGLVTWAELLGFEVIAAGKSSEYDFVFEPASGDVICNGVRRPLPALAKHWPSSGADAVSRAAARAEVLGSAFPLRTVPDLCEMTVVANATGLSADVAGFHAPPARIPEIANLFCERGQGGLLAGTRRVDVFHHLRLADEASFAGGVFVTVRCEDPVSWKLLEEKGHVVAAGGHTAALYLPRHLLGLECATSLLDAAGYGVSGYGSDYRPRQDLVAVAERDLPVGTVLSMGGHHHSIADVGGGMVEARPLGEDVPAPFYLVADAKLVRPVRAGDAIRLGDVALDETSPLFQARLKQDAMFFA
ncbi:NAD(P)H-dependent oxidoreductase [Bosea sp. BH3]|uniref:NAD(P)H-dependent oxidoreductase n=1 Tax=Bosea sp. BH3 TaxID=2871701 RepID=UPI0021CB570A|nr:flagellar biosynthesis protein FlgA [Bosea sp. BH3]MCU4182555.1 flagellar biosynthesis protein FlgA [Bosea sp. BH3]